MARQTRSAVRDARKPGWFYLDDAMIDHYGPIVGAVSIAVYAALARFANKDGQAFPAHKTLGDALDLSRNTVKAALRRLEDAKLITVDQQTDESGHPIDVNIYTLHAIAHHNTVCQEGRGSNIDRGVSEIDHPLSKTDQGGSSADRGVSESAYEGHVPLLENKESSTSTADDDGVSKKRTAIAPPDPMVAMLGSFGIMAAEQIAELYRTHYPDRSVDLVRQSIENELAGMDASDQYRIHKIAKKLKTSPPAAGRPWMRSQPKAAPAPLIATKPNIDPGALTPAERAARAPGSNSGGR